MRYIRRLPMKRIRHTKATCVTFSMIFKTITAFSQGIGLSYAFRICIINGCMAARPVNWIVKNNITMMAKGLRVRLFFISYSFSRNVGSGCEHCSFCLIQDLQNFNRSLCRLSSANSSFTVSLEAHPRIQQSDFSASIVRFFDKSHCGESGIYIDKTNSNLCYWM